LLFCETKSNEITVTLTHLSSQFFESDSIEILRSAAFKIFLQQSDRILSQLVSSINSTRNGVTNVVCCLRERHQAVKWSTQMQYNYNTTVLQYIFFLVLQLYCTCICRPIAIQVFYNLQKTCRLLVAVVKTCIAVTFALVRTAAIQPYFCIMLL